MGSFKRIAALVSILLFHLVSSSAAGQTTDSGNKKLIADARTAYYSLTRHNFNGYTATLRPNWKVILAETATPENLKVFRSQHFSMTVDRIGSVSVNREFDVVQRASTATYVKQIHENVQRLLSSFFGTWSFFMISSAFPEVRMNIENLGQEYQISYTVQSTDVKLKLTTDFLITEGRFFDGKVKRTIKPIFQKTPEGFLLTGYHIVFEPVGRGNKTTIETRIEYDEIVGLKLPGKIHIKGIYGAEPIEAELKFNDYELTAPRR